MSTLFILKSVEAVRVAILTHESEIESLDRAIGDGDHVVNIKRGVEAILAIQEELCQLAPDVALHQIGMKLLSTIGGASGPLLSSFFIAMGKSLKETGGKGTGEENLKQVAIAFQSGVTAVQHRGKSGKGEKTLLDVLIPVSDTFMQMTHQESVDQVACLRTLTQVAKEGVLSTREMIATKGRAAFLGERAIGHLDPGAKTTQLIIQAVCDLHLVSS